MRSGCSRAKPLQPSSVNQSLSVDNHCPGKVWISLPQKVKNPRVYFNNAGQRARYHFTHPNPKPSMALANTTLPLSGSKYRCESSVVIATGSARNQIRKAPPGEQIAIWHAGVHGICHPPSCVHVNTPSSASPLFSSSPWPTCLSSLTWHSRGDGIPANEPVARVQL